MVEHIPESKLSLDDVRNGCGFLDRRGDSNCGRGRDRGI